MIQSLMEEVGFAHPRARCAAECCSQSCHVADAHVMIVGSRRARAKVSERARLAGLTEKEARDRGYTAVQGGLAARSHAPAHYQRT